MTRFSDAVRVGDWLPFRCGDRVRERDGRHAGRVNAVLNGAWVRVRWEDTRWISVLPFADVQHTED